MFIKVPRPSLDSWSKALLKAREAQAIMVKADPMNEDLWEKNSKRGMDALKQSLKNLFKIGSFADWDEDDLNHEVGIIIEAHRSIMVSNP